MSVTGKLALLGGLPVRGEPLPPYSTIGEMERKAVLDVLDSGELSGFVAGVGEQFWGGKQVRELEKAFCQYFGCHYAVAVNSATSALHCATSALGLGPGDEVIVTPYTMSASATAILMTGAVPIFADIDPNTFCIDPQSVEERISPYTRGIMAVNIFGHPADLLPLRKIADQHGLFLIEDNAQAPDATYHGSKTGTIGDAGIFSLNRHKIIQSGEGGVLITNNEHVALKAALLRNHGEVSVEELNLQDITNTVGLNYRMTEIEAAIAKCQLARLPILTEQRIKLAERISKGLESVPGITPPIVKKDCTHVYYFYVMKFDEQITGLSRDLFTKAVQAEGFYLRSGYVKPIYLEPLYRQKICFGTQGFPFSANPREKDLHYRKGLCPITEELQDNTLMLTNITHPPLDGKDMDLFVLACEKVLANKEELLKFNTSVGH